VSASDWNKEQVRILEYSIDEVLKQDLVTMEFASIRYKDEDEWLVDLVKYWAWKDTYIINEKLKTVDNPHIRLIRMINFSMVNNRYAKLFLKLREFELPLEAYQIIEEVNRIKEEFIIKLFTDKGLPENYGKKQFNKIRPAFYGWISDKDDVIKSDLQKADFWGFLKGFMFPHLFEEKEV